MAEIAAEVIETVDQLADSWRAFVLDHGPGDVRDLPGMAVRWADSTFSFWNCVTLTDRDADAPLLEKRLAQAAAYMRGKSRPGFLWLFEDLLAPECRAELPRAAARAGLELSFTGYGMVGDFSLLAEPVHPELEFARVTTEEQLLAYADLNSRAYDMPLEAGREGLGGSELWKTGMYSYLGLKNGVPVSAAAIAEIQGRLFLALVATAAAEQRRGYGGATVRKALFEAVRATGLTRSVLHATPAGAPVYERMGYRKVSTIDFYVLKS